MYMFFLQLLYFCIFLLIEMPMEEHLAYNMSLCTALRSAMSLLYSLTLRPVSGNTVWSTPLHTHRNKDFNFLSSP